MASLNPTILARMAAAPRLLRDDYSITRAERVPDGGGGFTDGPETTVTGMCELVRNTGREEWTTADRVQERGEYTMNVAVAADVRSTDEVQIAGRTYRVVWSPEPGAGDLLKSFGLEELGGGAEA